jgi:hypothetical protein
MNSSKIADLPIPQSGCGDTRLCSDGLALTLEFEYRKLGQHVIGSVRFDGVIAYRFRNELHSLDYCSESYESIAEVRDSEWRKSLVDTASDGEASPSRLRHFALFLTSNGYFEILADQMEIGESRIGLLEED